MACLWFFPLAAESRIYQWVDKQGNTHFTDDLGQVPEEHRRQAQDRPVPTPGPNQPGVNQIPVTTVPGPPRLPARETVPGDELDEAESAQNLPPDKDRTKPEYWQKQASEKRDELAKAKQDLEQTNEALRKNLESGPGMQQRQADLSQKKTDLEAKIKQLESDLNQGLMDEARKEGVPPGWLR